MKKAKKTLSLLFALILMTSIFSPLSKVNNANAITFSQLNASNVFLKQEGSTTCTLCAATMMMRRYSMLRGDSNWSSITESHAKSQVWVNGGGLYSSFTYNGPSSMQSISVNNKLLPSDSASKEAKIKEELAKCPEGIVLYNANVPHAVLLTDYTDGTYYCADPLGSIDAGRIPLTSCYKVRISNATSYWKVTSPVVPGPTPDVCNCSTSYAGEYTTYNVSSNLTIRAGHGTGYGVLGSIPANATFTVTKADGSWAHITYNGISGFVSCDYIQKVHTHSFSAKDTSSTYLKSKATCTSAAVYYYKCSGCSEKGTSTYTSGSALGHDYTSKTTTSTYLKSSATCTAAATYYYKCSRCEAKGTSYYTSGSALGHDYTSKTTTSSYLKSEATCTSAATYYYKCSRCDAKGTSTYTFGSALGHDYTSKTTTSTYLKSSATCTAAATYYYKCSRCDAKGTNTYNSGSALGHDYTSKTMTSTYLKSEATCTAATTYYYKCSRCDVKGTSTYTSGSALGHDYTEKNTSATYLKRAATCTAAATYYYKCSRCTAKGTSTFTSGTTLPHTESSWITDKEATTTSAGSKHTECTVCHVTIKTETIPMLEPEYLMGDINGDGEVDAADAGLISRYDAGFITLTAEQLLAGDVNNDGEVDAADAGLISRYDAGFISSF